MTITIIGLGPGDPAHLTREAWGLLVRADEIYLRTARHPAVAALPARLTLYSFDDLYENSDDFCGVYEVIAKQIVALGHRPQGVIYCVPGHPRIGESSVQRILARARQEGQAVRLVEGLSFVEPALGLLGIDGLAGLQLWDAASLAGAHHPPLDPDHPVLIGQLYGQRLGAEVKRTLLNVYPGDHPITLVRAAGTAEGSTTTLALAQLDSGPLLDHLTTLYLPPLPYSGGLPALQETVARLRAPGGCPWDQEQTHLTLRDDLLEETYEVLEALDAGDDEKLCEELGDLLMQVTMHAQIATERDAFKLPDIVSRIDAKLKRRHPHVFGDVQVQGTDDVLRNWEAIKADERSEDGNSHATLLDGVPTILPALARAQALGDRAARTGFDWPDIEGVLDKLDEEITELREAGDPAGQEQEFGDLLFTLVNTARWLDLDAEGALRAACDRFTHRFSQMESMARAQGIDLADLSLADLDALWDQAKAGEA